MPPLDSTSTMAPNRGVASARSNMFGWAPPDLCMPPDVGEPVQIARPRNGRLTWSVEPVPAWPGVHSPGAQPLVRPDALGPAPVTPKGAGNATLRAAKPLGRNPASAPPPAQPVTPPTAGIASQFAAYRAPLTDRDAAREFGPSRLAYRLNRLWLSPGVRPFIRMGLPVLLVALFVGVWLADEARRQSVADVVVSARHSFVSQPMFTVNSVEVTSRSPEVAEGVHALLSVPVPVSSWDLNLQALRETAQSLDAVDTASVQVIDGVLHVRLTERLPAMVWRHENGLDLVDAQGFRVARLTARAARPDLPLIAGLGAPEAIAEAQQLLAAAQPWAGQIRGLVRVGMRRWDVVLASGQRVLLPAEGALGALERVIALDSTQSLLQRDVSVVDMRLPARPTLRLSPEGAQVLADIRRLELEGGL